MLYFVGLGLGNEKDITVKGLEAVRSCEQVFLENYTSILGIDKEKLEEFYGVPILYADREKVESDSDAILLSAREQNVAFLVVGDPFCATTHTDMWLRAKELGIEVQAIHNASIMNAAGCCGLQLYYSFFFLKMNNNIESLQIFFWPNRVDSIFYRRLEA